MLSKGAMLLEYDPVFIVDLFEEPFVHLDAALTAIKANRI